MGFNGCKGLAAIRRGEECDFNQEEEGYVILLKRDGLEIKGNCRNYKRCLKQQISERETTRQKRRIAITIGPELLPDSIKN